MQASSSTSLKIQSSGAKKQKEMKSSLFIDDIDDIETHKNLQITNVNLRLLDIRANTETSWISV